MNTFNSERGTSLVEYAMLVVFLAVVALGAIGVVGGETKDTFGSAAVALAGELAPSTTTAPTSTTATPTTTVTTSAPTTTVTTAAAPTPTHGGGPGPCTGAKKDRPPSCP